MKYLNTLILSTAFLLTACQDKTPPPTIESVMREAGAVHKDNSFPFAVVEEQRLQGKQNAAAAAAEYQRQNPRLHGWESIIKTDTTQSSTCPQGDGWTEVVFMRTEREEGKTKNLQVEKATTMCSTVSTLQGCVMVSPVDNWSKHPAKLADGQCASTRDVPYPLPKVVGAK
jgi:hypothetical protein